MSDTAVDGDLSEIASVLSWLAQDLEGDDDAELLP